MSINFIMYLNCTVSFKSYMIPTRVKNQNTTTNNKVKAAEQIFVLHPIKSNNLTQNNIT